MNSLLKHTIIVGSILLPAFGFSQEIEKDTLTPKMTVKTIDEIEINRSLNLVMVLLPLEALGRESIEALNTDDVAGLLSKVPGANIKSYGGLGGLKTVSLRGLGGEHTAILIDGFQVTNAQSGQMNLGQLQSDGLVTVSAGSKHYFRALMPVSSDFAGNHVNLVTFMNYRYAEGQNMKASVRYGSFMRREAYVQGDQKTARWHVGAFGKYRDAQGSYPFQFLNGSTLTDGSRGNNDYQDMHFGLKLGRVLKDEKELRVIYRTSFIDQGLPGAVIFYNESADERLNTQDHRVMLDYRSNNYNKNYRLYLNAGNNHLQYTDPTYLSAAGEIHDHYRNYSINGGYVHNKSFEKFELKWGGEQRMDLLGTNRVELGQPLRLSTYGLAGIRKAFSQLELEALAGAQYVYDDNNSLIQQHLQFTPSAHARLKLRSEKSILQFFYKRNFRLPSFNELYFGQVGNNHLVPEIAHQFNLGWYWKIRESYYRWRWELNPQAYFNRVQNKIVAIPTKNLFVWSMQNVAEAQVYGASIETQAVRRMRNEMRLEFLGNYTWQRVVDVTPDAITFGHQVAYAPEHTANADVMFVGKGFNVRVSNNFVSGRYALNQNVPANFLEPFWTMDLSAGYTYKIKNKHKVGVQLNVRNLTNESYAFIRSYVMPGRQYLLTLKYEIL
ncbi:MAG: TonB-dependent receptor [Crocinitomicaceae bacterium]